MNKFNKIYKMINSSNKNIIIWANGTNGEGSSNVVFSLVNAAFKNNNISRNTYIIISKDTVIHNLITKNSMNTTNVIVLPAIFRSYLLHSIIKLFFPIQFFGKRLLTLDDYPFRFYKKQILYFHQAGILYGASLNWHIRRLFIRILISNNLFIFTQTDHIKDKLINIFKIERDNILTNLHDV